MSTINNLKNYNFKFKIIVHAMKKGHQIKFTGFAFVWRSCHLDFEAVARFASLGHLIFATETGMAHYCL
jgi:hypothetical protein